ncbi:DUF1905 domain-containing protein [Paenarthrobacter sp. NPDC089322]|uniref:DUF1905 domain-containing protein n=1 Tax=Paenarthrobacter sp. NPDC089322 TaxID=3155065 RepID=UPI00343D1C93
MAGTYSFNAELWLYPGEAGWHFITLPAEVADSIREQTRSHRRGFGSVKVSAEISGCSWPTSLFPDAGTGSYLLPVKKSVRARAGIQAGDTVHVVLDVSEES